MRSFRTLLCDLATLTLNTVHPRLPDATPFEVVTRPTPLQARASNCWACACSVPSGDPLIFRYSLKNPCFKPRRLWKFRQDQLKAAGAFWSPSKQRYTPPEITTFHNVLAALPPETLDNAIGQ